MFFKQTCICLTHSTPSVKKVGYLRKRRHNRLLSPRLCSKVKKYVPPQLTQRLVSLFSQWFPKYVSKPKQGRQTVKKGSHRGDPSRSCVFSTQPLLVCLYRYVRREETADIKNELRREVFTKLKFGSGSKKFGSHWYSYSNVNVWSLFFNPSVFK